MPAIQRILHIAPFNISGVPITFVRAERSLGYVSRLITLARDARGYEEDLCLELPWLTTPAVQWAKRLFSDPRRLQVGPKRAQSGRLPPRWQPHTRVEKWLVAMREHRWRSRIAQVMAESDFWNFDLYQLDGGLEFYRDGRTVRELKRRGKQVICLYTGSDLRTRGIVPAVDAEADLRLTLEFDHLALDSGLVHVFFPFEFDRVVPPEARPVAEEIVIGHAPTQRNIKGSAVVLDALHDLAQEYPIRLELIEGLPHAEAMRRKARCDIFVDTVSELGYGVNAIEALALGVCTCTSLMPEFLALYSDHPFVAIDAVNVREELRRLCADPARCRALGRQGRVWAEQHHGAAQVVRRIHSLLQKNAHSVHQ